MEGPLYHLVPRASWDVHKRSKTPYFPPTYEQVRSSSMSSADYQMKFNSYRIDLISCGLRQDGFIHLTKDPKFLIGVANNFYSSRNPWEWICLRINPAGLTSLVINTVVFKASQIMVKTHSVLGLNLSICSGAL